MRTIAALTLLALAFSTQSATAGDIESGLQVGDYPGAYKVEDVTGDQAGTVLCYRCQYGARPVVNIFAREMNDRVAKLVQEVDRVVGKNRTSEKMAAFVVLLTDKPDAAAKGLKQTASKLDIKYTPMTVYKNAAGPNRYRISEDADVTVMMWVENDVKVNHALKTDQLDGKKIAAIVSDTQKILN